MSEPYKCPACGGQGTVSKPPYIAGDQPTWTAPDSTFYPCPACKGTGIVWETDSATFLGMDEAAKAMREKLESIFGQDDPDEAGPGERRTGREIKEIAAMILQEAGRKK